MDDEKTFPWNLRGYTSSSGYPYLREYSSFLEYPLLEIYDVKIEREALNNDKLIVESAIYPKKTGSLFHEHERNPLTFPNGEKLFKGLPEFSEESYVEKHGDWKITRYTHALNDYLISVSQGGYSTPMDDLIFDEDSKNILEDIILNKRILRFDLVHGTFIDNKKVDFNYPAILKVLSRASSMAEDSKCSNLFNVGLRSSKHNVYVLEHTNPKKFFTEQLSGIFSLLENSQGNGIKLDDMISSLNYAYKEINSITNEVKLGLPFTNYTLLLKENMKATNETKNTVYLYLINRHHGSIKEIPCLGSFKYKGLLNG